MSPGEDIRTARTIHAILYGDESVEQVDVKAWMETARTLTEQLRTGTIQATLDKVREIPYNLIEQLIQAQ